MNLDYQTRVLLEEKRKQRLQQVRNQEKEIASKTREEYNNRKNDRVSSLQGNLKASWNKNHQELVNDQNQKFLDAVSAMGNAHLAAEQKILQKESQKAVEHENWLQNRQQQMERFDKAMNELHAKTEEREKELQHRRARLSQVKESEKQRASERIKKYQQSQKSEPQVSSKVSQTNRMSDKKQSLAMFENTYFHQRIEKANPIVKQSVPSAMEAAQNFKESKEQQEQQKQAKYQQRQQKEAERYKEAVSDILTKKEEEQKEKEHSKQARLEREKKIKEVTETAAVISKASQPPPPKKTWVDTELKKVLENSRQKRKQAASENFPSKIDSIADQLDNDYVVVPNSDLSDEAEITSPVHRPSKQDAARESTRDDTENEPSPIPKTNVSIEKLEEQLEEFERELENRILYIHGKKEAPKEAWKEPTIPNDRRDSLGTSRLSYMTLSDSDSDIFSISSASPLNLSGTDSWVQAPAPKLKSPTKSNTVRGTTASPGRRPTNNEDSLLYSPNTTLDADPEFPTTSLSTALSMRTTRDYRRDDPVYYKEQPRNRSIQDYTQYDSYEPAPKSIMDLDAELAKLEAELAQQKVTQARSPKKNFDELLLQEPPPGSRPRTLWPADDSMSTLPTTQTTLDSEAKFIEDSSFNSPVEDKGDNQGAQPSAALESTTEEESLHDESSLIDDDGMSLQQRFELFKKKFETRSKERQNKIQEKFAATQARRKQPPQVAKKPAPKPVPLATKPQKKKVAQTSKSQRQPNKSGR